MLLVTFHPLPAFSFCIYYGGGVGVGQSGRGLAGLAWRGGVSSPRGLLGREADDTP